MYKRSIFTIDFKAVLLNYKILLNKWFKREIICFKNLPGDECEGSGRDPGAVDKSGPGVQVHQGYAERVQRERTGREGERSELANFYFRKPRTRNRREKRTKQLAASQKRVW